MYVPMAPVGSEPFVALIHASAKHVEYVNCPLTQATEMMNGSMLSFTSALTWVFEKPVEPHDVVEP